VSGPPLASEAAYAASAAPKAQNGSERAWVVRTRGIGAAPEHVPVGKKRGIPTRWSATEVGAVWVLTRGRLNGAQGVGTG
jgi:hypothetical protein